MAAPARVEGPNLVLRLILPADAEYVYGLRTNPSYNTYLSEVRGTAEDQRHWIEAYKAREAKGHEFYYVIERSDGVRCGVVRLYDITVDQVTWGSWILDHNKPNKAALESAVLSFGACFTLPGIMRALIDVRRANLHAQAFYCRFGMIETHADAQDRFFSYTRETFLRDREKHLSVLVAASR